jgi:hypothetical protein
MELGGNLPGNLRERYRSKFWRRVSVSVGDRWKPREFVDWEFKRYLKGFGKRVSPFAEALLEWRLSGGDGHHPMGSPFTGNSEG